MKDSNVVKLKYRPIFISEENNFTNNKHFVISQTPLLQLFFILDSYLDMYETIKQFRPHT